MAEDIEDIYWNFRPPNGEQLRRSIVDAFADAVSPGDGDRDIIVSGHPGCCAECGETHALFRGKHWRELAESGEPLLGGLWGGLPLLTAKAWRFYLPAYLLRSLSGGDDAEHCLTAALYSLTPDTPAQGHRDFFTERTSGFSVAQQVCIAAYSRAAIEPGEDDEDGADDEAFRNDEAFYVAATYWQGRVAEIEAQQGVA